LIIVDAALRAREEQGKPIRVGMITRRKHHYRLVH